MSGQRHVSWLLVVLWLTACHSNPPQPPQAPVAGNTTLLSGLSNYARQLQQQDEPALLAEKARLESLPESPARNLRLALVLGHEPAAFYDPERATTLLARTANEPNADPAERSVAEVLLASTPRLPRSCEQTGFTRELADRLSAEEQRRQELAARLETMRQELDSERVQRTRLEKQLEALKSIETQINSRESDAGR
jgi:hypothetical protein